jgi:hypothetical protein
VPKARFFVEEDRRKSELSLQLFMQFLQRLPSIRCPTRIVSSRVVGGGEVRQGGETEAAWAGLLQESLDWGPNQGAALALVGIGWGWPMSLLG